MSEGFVINTQRCYGCKTCMVACANEHLLRPGVFIRRIREFASPKVDGRNNACSHGRAFVSMSCNHCDDPACLAHCPVRAYTKDEATGLVIQNHSRCIGCQTCVQVCPFHAPRYDEADSTTYKCDGCIGRQQRGLPPMCEVVCPSANITMGDFDGLLEQHQDATSLKDLVETHPNYAAVLDPDISIDNLVGIDEASGLVSRGAE